MSERYAVQSGDWSNINTWNGGSLPGVGDDVHANGFDVVIDQDVEVQSLTTRPGDTAVDGGKFTPNNNTEITANIVAGGTTCLDIGTKTGIIVTGNVTGGTDFGKVGISSLAGSSITINGNCVGGSGFAANGVNLQGTVVINGNVQGSDDPDNSGCNGANLYNDVVAVINGNAIGGNGAFQSYGLTSSGIQAVITLNGDVIPSSVNPAVNFGGTIIHNGDIQPASNGTFPILTSAPAGKWLVDPSASMTYAFRKNDGGSPGDVRNFESDGGGNSIQIGPFIGPFI